MKIRPLHDWAVIKRTDEGERTAGGIIIPAVAREKPAEGIVEAIGPGKYETREGKGKKERFLPTTVKTGQRVAFIDFMAKNVEIDGQDVTLVREADMLGTYEEGKYPVARESHSVSVKGEDSLLFREKRGEKSAIQAAGVEAASMKKDDKKKKAVKRSSKPAVVGRTKLGKKKPKAAKEAEKKSERKSVEKTAGKTAQKSTSQKRRKTTSAKPLSGKTGGKKKVQPKK